MVMGMTSCAAFSCGHHSNGELNLGCLGGRVLILSKQFPCGALGSGHGYSSRCMDGGVW